MKTAIAVLLHLLAMANAGKPLETIRMKRLVAFGRSNNPAENPRPKVECQGEWRLPENVLPSHYELTLKVHDDSLRFSGSVKIDVKCVQRTNTIVMHSKDLNISIKNISVRNRKGEQLLRVLHSSADDKHEMIHLRLNATLETGSSYTIDIPNYAGKVRQDPIGLYQDTYNVEDESRKIFVSQFEPTYARMVFPCFDEPNMRATFIVNIERPAAYTSFSNMPIKISKPLQDRFLDTFEKSLLMPTYLLAVALSDYSQYPQNRTSRTHILVPQKDIGEADFAYHVASDALQQLESYMNISYPLNKIDIFSTWSTTHFEAMENWGLVISNRENIIEAEDTYFDEKLDHVLLIVHELAHQWFGNMVTLEWWSYTWLNEGFATFFEYYITDKLFPDWRTSDLFVFDVQGALKSDGDMSTTPMTNKVCSLEEINACFGDISYFKAAGVIRMFESILGHELLFQSAIRSYLENRRMKNARPNDWFSVLDDVISDSKYDNPLPENVTFVELGENWTEQAGFPLVTVTRNYTSGSVSVEQERFYKRNSTNTTHVDPHASRWWIPLTWTTASAPDPELKPPQEWLYENRTLPLDLRDNDWILFNTNARGYYRVNYDDTNWSLLTKALQQRRQDFSSANRMSLLDDAFTLARSHRLDMRTFLDLTQFMKDEDNAVVWNLSAEHLNTLLDLTGSTPVHEKLEKFIQRLVDKAYRRVRLDKKAEEPVLDNSLRTQAAYVACKVGLDLFLADAEEKLAQFFASPGLHKESRPGKLLREVEVPILCGGIRFGGKRGKELFEKVRSVAVEGNFNDTIYTSALQCTQNESLIIWHLEDLIQNNTRMNKTQVQSAIKLVVAGDGTKNVGFQFVQQNASKISRFFGFSKNYTEGIVKEIVSAIRTNQQYEEVYKWVSSSEDDELGNKTRILEKLRLMKPKVEWTDYTVQQITDWFASKSSPESL